MQMIGGVVITAIMATVFNPNIAIAHIKFFRQVTMYERNEISNGFFLLRCVVGWV